MLRVPRSEATAVIIQLSGFPVHLIILHFTYVLHTLVYLLDH